MNVTKLINDVLTSQKLYDLVEKYGKEYGLYNMTIDLEYEPILYMLENNKDNITLITRLLNFFEILDDLDDDLEINYYCAIFFTLQKLQIKNCKKEDKWYFKNLGLL